MKALSILATVLFCTLIIVFTSGFKTTGQTPKKPSSKSKFDAPVLSAETTEAIWQDTGLQNPAYIIAIGKNNQITMAMSEHYENMPGLDMAASSLDRTESFMVMNYEKNLTELKHCKWIVFNNDAPHDDAKEYKLCRPAKNASPQSTVNDIPVMSKTLRKKIKKETDINKAILLIAYDNDGNKVLARHPKYVIAPSSDTDSNRSKGPHKKIKDVSSISITNFTKNPACVWLTGGGSFYLFCEKV